MVSFEKIGLSVHESKVLDVLFSNGLTKVFDILKTSGINSGKIYDTLDGLLKKKLIVLTKVNNVKHFECVSKEGFKNYFNEKRRKINNENRMIDELFLSKKKQKSEVSNAFYYRGSKVLEDLLDDMSDEKAIKVVGLNHFLKVKVKRIVIDFILQKNVVQNKNLRVLVDERVKINQKNVRISKKYFPLMVIGVDKMLLINGIDDVSCVKIHDKKIVKSYSNFFLSEWRLS